MITEKGCFGVNPLFFTFFIFKDEMITQKCRNKLDNLANYRDKTSETANNSQCLVVLVDNKLSFVIGIEDVPGAIEEGFLEILAEHADQLAVFVFDKITAMDIHHLFGTKTKEFFGKKLIGVKLNPLFDGEAALLGKCNHIATCAVWICRVDFVA